MAAFLEALERGETVVASIALAGWNTKHCYKTRHANAEFAKAWDTAENAGADLLIAEAQRRAVRGVDKTIFYKGVPIGIETNYSDMLLMFLIKKRRPYDYDDGMRRAKAEREWRKEDGDVSVTPVTLQEIGAAIAALQAAKALTAQHGNRAA